MTTSCRLTVFLPSESAASTPTQRHQTDPLPASVDLFLQLIQKRFVVRRSLREQRGKALPFTSSREAMEHRAEPSGRGGGLFSHCRRKTSEACHLNTRALHSACHSREERGREREGETETARRERESKEREGGEGKGQRGGDRS
ncbi:hypothetical protein JZ751_027345 [Albula glossodonta]|uniref:Uncharacterized protein n=1 Tax=Albula glossodonta TaxID=121402 RepID=A0A8T2MR68_9TELE|nr:hypothetical protein JZ751_027345 [Albula glossodonta]